MTDLATMPEPDATPNGRSPSKVVTAVIAVAAILGVAVVVIWWRRGGGRRAITGLAEEGAVRLADAIIDEVLGAA